MGLLHVAINVSDLEESIAFYGELFGMEPVEETDGDVRQVWIGRDGEAALQLRDGSDGSIGPTGVDHIAIAVENVDAKVGRLAPDRIEREPTVLESWGIRTAFVTDPDGYVIELIQELE